MLTRFAPSPTGYLHVGNVRTALVCWLYAKSEHGKFILRFDDTDAVRSQLKFFQNIIDDLQWLGLNWDDSFKQSERLYRYDEIFKLMLNQGSVYTCYESKEELEIKRKMQLKSGKAPIYDRSALLLLPERRAQLEQERKPYYRFKMDESATISWHDEVRGEVVFFAKNISDPIIRREDGTYTYMLPSVIDDNDFGITHVVRGEDHISNTAVQIAMFQSLGASVPKFAHLSLLHSDDNKISKRSGGADVKSLREDGIEAMTVNSYLARLGTSLPIKQCSNLQQLVDSFDIHHFSRSATSFMMEDLHRLNHKILQQMSYEDVRARLVAENMDSEDFWYSIRNNIETFQEIVDWWRICHGNVTTVIADADREFLVLASNLLPTDHWNEQTWSEWIANIKQNTERKAKDIFMPLRLALTGARSGPELAKVLPLMKRDVVLSRLRS